MVIARDLKPIPPIGTVDPMTRMDEILMHILAKFENVTSLAEMKALMDGSHVPYAVKSFKLDAVRDQEEIEIDGDHLLAACNGTLAGIEIKLNKKSNDAIPFALFNPVASKFFKLFLTNSVQAGKTLYLFIGRESATEATTSTSLVTTNQAFYIIKTLKGTHFTGALAQFVKEDENLTGLLADNIRITGIVIEADQQLHFKALFWHKDSFDNTDHDIDEFCGEVDLDLATYGIQIGGANQWYLDVRNLHLDYIDSDGTKDLHVSQMTMSAVAKGASGAGETILKIT